MPLGWISAIQCNWLRWSNRDRTADLTSPCVCSATKCPTSNTLISCIHMRWGGTALSPTSYILLSCRKLIFIYIIIISGKMYLKSKLQRCLYVKFYQSYEDLWTGSTQQGGWVGPCLTPAGSSTALTSDAWTCDQAAVTGTFTSCAETHTNGSTNQSPEDGRNWWELHPKLIRPGECHSEFIHQIWAQLYALWFVCKCVETAWTLRGQEQYKFNGVWPQIKQRSWLFLIFPDRTRRATMFLNRQKSYFCCFLKQQKPIVCKFMSCPSVEWTIAELP